MGEMRATKVAKNKGPEFEMAIGGEVFRSNKGNIAINCSVSYKCLEVVAVLNPSRRSRCVVHDV